MHKIVEQRSSLVSWGGFLELEVPHSLKFFVWSSSNSDYSSTLTAIWFFESSLSSKDGFILVREKDPVNGDNRWASNAFISTYPCCRVHVLLAFRERWFLRGGSAVQNLSPIVQPRKSAVWEGCVVRPIRRHIPLGSPRRRLFLSVFVLVVYKYKNALKRCFFLWTSFEALLRAPRNSLVTEFLITGFSSKRYLLNDRATSVLLNVRSATLRQYSVLTFLRCESRGHPPYRLHTS